jgi:hypothetical protein
MIAKGGPYAYSYYGALVLQTFHAMPHDVYMLHTALAIPATR